MEISSSIFLGALYQMPTINYLDYIYNALNVRMLGLSRDNAEARMIIRYIKQSFADE